MIKLILKFMGFEILRLNILKINLECFNFFINFLRIKEKYFLMLIFG